jgi:tetratricopeptide (TPR) repeat protein
MKPKPPMDGEYSPILYDYLKKYQDNPRSKVFAPLAEAYRKAGLVDEAIEIAREGLLIHPTFIGGKVALGRALFDKKEFSRVIDILGSVVQEAPDNWIAQRLFADSCLMEGRVLEALQSYKMLLYIHPSDLEVSRLVQDLESRSYEEGAILLTERDRTASLHLATREETPVTPIEPSQVFSPAEGPTYELDQSPRYAPRQDLERGVWIRQIELLQDLLRRVDSHRSNIEA